MKLYHHPASTTSRPILLLAAEAGIALDLQVVDLFSGEHLHSAYAAINPNRLVPVLEDGKFRLTEHAAIMKYLAEKAGSALYPRALQARARIDERMDWVNTQLCRDLAYGVVYPQVFPSHRRRSDEAQQATLQWSLERARRWVDVLDRHFLADQPFLCGEAMTLADLQAACFVAMGELVGCRYREQPNLRRWLARMKALPSWPKVHAVIDGYAATLDRSAMQSL
jgi:glutathione S-transferase